MSWLKSLNKLVKEKHVAKHPIKYAKTVLSYFRHIEQSGISLLVFVPVLWWLKSNCKCSWCVWHEREQPLTLKLGDQVFVFKDSFSTFLLTTPSFTGSEHDWFHLLHHLDSHPALHLVRLVLLGVSGLKTASGSQTCLDYKFLFPRSVAALA